MKKFLVSDYDRTFYIDDEDLKRNIVKVEQFRARDNIFAIATGRSYYDFNRVTEKKPIKYDYLILNQGATILDSDGNIIENYPIEEKIKESLITELNLFDQDNMFACKSLDSRVSIKEKEITKIYIKYDTFEEAKKKSDLINEKYKDEIISYITANDNALEIISAKTNKGSAIQVVADIENVQKMNIYTIGDSYNDIEMLTVFNGYNVKGAINEVKKISKGEFESVSDFIDDICKSNVS